MYEFITNAYIIKKARYQKPGANWIRYEVVAYDPASGDLVTGVIPYATSYKGNAAETGRRPLKFYVNGKKIVDYTSRV